jgi:RimJ/RimL family protein N-acetyltransferase
VSSVRLREVEDRDVAALDRLMTPDGGGEYNYFGMTPVGSAAEDLAAGRLSPIERRMLVAELSPERETIGVVTWHEVRHGPNPESGAWNIGIALLPEARGRGFGGPVQRQLAERLFATSEVNRVEATVDVENGREQRALQKAGFTREGVLRGAQNRLGRWHDLVLYSLLRADVTGPP